MEYTFELKYDRPLTIIGSIIAGYSRAVQGTKHNLTLLHINPEDAVKLREAMKVAPIRFLRIVEDDAIPAGSAKLTLDEENLPDVV